MANNPPSINLVKTHVGFVDLFIKWAVTIGRLLVVVVEIIALSMFLYRFSLDRQLIDLRSKISAEAKVVSFLKDRENTYRNLQDRLTLISSLSKKDGEVITILNDVLSFTPSDMKISSLDFTGNSIKINADFQSVSSLTVFASKLNNYSKIDSASIDNIENNTLKSVISVGITGILKEGVIQ